MSLIFTITSDFREAEELGRRLGSPKRFLDAWAQGVAKQARENARAKGGRKFWHDVAKATQVTSVSDTQATVGCNYAGAAFKETGGTISAPGKGPGAKGSKFLAIPIDAAARASGNGPEYYGRSFDMMFIPYYRNGEKRFLMGKVTNKGKKNEKFTALFALVKSVTQKADPWLPTEARIAEIGTREFMKLFRG